MCVDCKAEGLVNKRVVKYPGPRCYSHHKMKRRSRRDYSHAQHILETYGITSEQYWEIYRHQGGVCAICNRARGLKKKLSVDHCHKTGMVRGLLCQKCNRDVLGHLRDDPTLLQNAIDYLRSPPAVQAIGVVITPDMKEV
ncbi:endonuclease VII [Gordonia phage Anon]|nr:endonuclease VII [Gordonia phage Anon]